MEEELIFRGEEAGVASKILSHPLSRQIMDALGSENLHVNRIAEETRNHPATIHRHLKLLEKIGMVKSEITQEDCPTICKRYSLRYRCFKVEHIFCEDGPETEVRIDTCC
jgi:DNA-binding transcriptional ArsR family regulator